MLRKLVLVIAAMAAACASQPKAAPAPPPAPAAPPAAELARSGLAVAVEADVTLTDSSRSREIPVHVHPPLRVDRIEQLGDRRAHEWPPRLHRPWGEVLVHHLPHGGVQGTVLLDQLIAAK